MDKTSVDHGDETLKEMPRNERHVYVLPDEIAIGRSGDELNLIEMWHILRRGKWWIVATTILLALATLVYVLLADKWYRADVLLAPAEEQRVQGLAAQFGGLASLAGIGVDGGNTVEPVAVVKSREFARAFIEDFQLLPVFFADDWNAARNQWSGDDPEEWPDMRDAVQYFHDKVLRVTEDIKTGLVTLAVDWKDPIVAAEWANEIVRRLNSSLRERALREAESNVAYLHAEMAKTNVITLQQSIGSLLENELQKLMLARGNEEFAFRVIDPATVPKDPEWPRPAIFMLVSAMLGALIGMLIVLLRHVLREGEKGLE